MLSMTQNNSMRVDFIYKPSPTGILFHESDAKLKLITGPFGSGKSCIIVNDLQFYSWAQAPAPNGVRYTHIGVIRGTSGEVNNTSRKSIEEVWPAKYGGIQAGGYPTKGHYYGPLGDGSYEYVRRGDPWRPGYGTFMHVGFSLYGLSVPEDAEKIKSANWSFAWISEPTNIDFAIVSAALGRVGRYPPKEMGGCSYAGVLMDFNQPPPGHYLHTMMQNPEENWAVFKQPPAAFKVVDDLENVTYKLNEEAENLENLKGGTDYYRDQIAAYKLEGRTDLIDSLFCMEDTPIRDGKPVWPEFKYDLHVAHKEIEPLAYNTVIVGYDTSGIHPGAVLYQENQGRWAIVDELYGEGMGLDVFVEHALMPLIANKYPTCQVIVSCDPANAKDSYTGLSPTVHLQQKGFEIYLPKTNAPKIRIQAVSQLLNRNVGGLIISPHCKLVISAMQGGYKYPRLRIHGSVGAVYNPNPVKNKDSHIADAVQYGAMFINQGNFANQRDVSNIVNRLSKRRKTLRRIM